MTLESAVPQSERVAAFFRKHRTGLVTVVFTDLVDSTRLKQQLGDTRAVTLVHQHHAGVRDWLSTSAEATEVETAGDSFLLLFARPSDAVRFALGLHRRNRHLSEEAGVKLEDRIGLHAGEVFVQDQVGDAKLFGSQVDVCGRVVNLVQGSQILMTRFVFDNARGVLRGTEVEGVQGLQWLNHGNYRFKGVEGPVEVCEVRVGTEGLVTPPSGSDKAQRVAGEGELVLGWRPGMGLRWLRSPHERPVRSRYVLATIRRPGHIASGDSDQMKQPVPPAIPLDPSPVDRLSNVHDGPDHCQSVRAHPLLGDSRRDRRTDLRLCLQEGHV